jgi:hypothetical protein
MPIPGMTGGDATPIVKYNAKARLWKVDDVPLNTISFVIDMDNAEAGWSLFRENTAPDFVMVPVIDLAGGQPYPAQPSEDHRKGFRCLVKIPDKLAAGKASVREFASNSLAVRRAFDNLYDAWLLERKEHPGQLPVVTCKTYDEVTTKHGSNFAPIFTITGWIKRPADLGKSNGSAAAAGNVPLDVPEAEVGPDPIGEPEDFSEADFAA